MSGEMNDQPARPQYIREQHNSGCQQFFGPVTGCIFAMPGANITQQTAGVPVSAVSQDTTKKPRVTPRVPKMETDAEMTKRELMTFSKNGILDAHIRLLYASMTANRWIDTRTTETDFLDLFSGRRCECSIIWAGTYGKGTLVMLFCQMIAEGLVSIPKGFTIARVLEGHFTDKSGKFLTNLDHGDPCAAKALPEIKEFIRILKTRAGSRGYETDDYCTGYDEGYDPYDHQDLHLHNRH